MKKTFLSFGLVLVAAAPLSAQNVNASDIQISTAITGSVGGIFSPSNGGGVTLASAPIGASVAAATSVSSALSAGTLTSALALNALIAAAPASMLTNPPPALLAVHAALTSFSASLK